MKKSNIFVMALLLTFSSSLSANVYAKDKPKKVNITGSNLNVDGEAPKKAPGATGNIFYDSTIGKKAPEAPKAVAATPIPVEVPIGTGSVNPSEVRKNQMKEDYIAKGKILLANNEYSKALEEFKKARTMGSDYMVEGWIDVAANKIRVKELNKKIDEINAKKGP